jgi:hypothetical protein
MRGRDDFGRGPAVRLREWVSFARVGENFPVTHESPNDHAVDINRVSGFLHQFARIENRAVAMRLRRRFLWLRT